ncbi:hypothetical protein M231_06715 [Tremella mesenterica]|uniref:Myb-like domain-containing protein n=1 Tax=Tremella mesenterica TaxID=5217 RepID=A0A4Q1BG21_TREME|nr:hypothetical protein M231_06715 [Tremella mesenterica]
MSTNSDSQVKREAFSPSPELTTIDPTIQNSSAKKKTSSPGKKPSTPSKKRAASSGPSEEGSAKKRKPQAAKRVWTKEEDDIFAELIERVCSKHLWNEVKEDGRLEYRGGPGIRAHTIASLKTLRKSAPGN